MFLVICEDTMIKQYKILVILILLDIVLTIWAVKYLGAKELNPLCINFEWFIIVKIAVSIMSIWGVYYYRNTKDKYFQYAVIITIIIYTIVLFWNLWQTANYLYY